MQSVSRILAVFRNPSRAAGFRFAIVFFWLAAMLCLARYEAFPELFTRTLRGYGGVVDETVLMQESWSRILVNGVPAGYSHTSMGVEDEGRDRNVEIHNRTQLKLALLGQPFGVHVHTTLLLDPAYDLLQFESAVSARGMSLRVKGRRVEAQTYAITTFSGDTEFQQEVVIPEDVILYSPMNTLALRRLRPGQSLIIKTMDPLSMSTARVLVKAVETQTIHMGDEAVDSTLLVSHLHGMQFRSWVDRRGNLLRQETPLGWVIESSTPDEALDAVSGNHSPPDLATLSTGAALLQLLLTKENAGQDEL
jgi:hypothetical protein